MLRGVGKAQLCLPFRMFGLPVINCTHRKHQHNDKPFGVGVGTKMQRGSIPSARGSIPSPVTAEQLCPEQTAAAVAAVVAAAVKRVEGVVRRGFPQ